MDQSRVDNIAVDLLGWHGGIATFTTLHVFHCMTRPAPPAPQLPARPLMSCPAESRTCETPCRFRACTIDAIRRARAAIVQPDDCAERNDSSPHESQRTARYPLHLASLFIDAFPAPSIVLHWIGSHTRIGLTRSTSSLSRIWARATTSAKLAIVLCSSSASAG